MWEAYEMENEDFIWAGITFLGGISGQQRAPCGAVSASAVCLGLRHRCSLADKERAKQARKAAYEDANELVGSFIQKFGALTCFELLGFNFSDEEAVKQAIESGIFEEKCNNHVQFAIEKLYELDDRRSVTE